MDLRLHVSTPLASSDVAPRPGLVGGILALLVAMAAVLRWLHIATKSFWFDEGVSVAIARLDWYNFVRLLWRREANMSLYYLMLRGWLHFGQNEAFIRSLSVILAVATVPAFYWLGRQLLGWRPALIASALLTVNAYHVRYSQEARSYTLYVLMATLSAAFYVAAIRNPSPRHCRWFVVCTVLAFYSHFYAGLLIVVEWLALRWAEPRLNDTFRNCFRWIAILIAPGILFAATTGVGPLKWIQRPTFLDIWEYYKFMAGNGGSVLLLLICATIGAALLPAIRVHFSTPFIGWFRDPKTWPVAFLLLWTTLPVMLTVMVSFVRPMFVARYFILCLPPFLLLAATGVARVPSRWRVAAIVGILAGLSVQGIWAYYRADFDLVRDNYRDATNYVLSRAQPGDVVLFNMAMGRMPYEYYRSLNPGAHPPTVIYPGRPDGIGYRDFLGQPSDDFLLGTAHNYSRVWIVVKRYEAKYGADPTANFIDENFNRFYRSKTVEDFQGVQIRLYEK